MAAAKQGLGLEIERAQELALPAVPDPRPHRADVGDGEQQQQLQPLRALHQRGEIAHRLRIVEIAALRDLAHGEVVLDQPHRRLGLRGVEPEARAQLAGDAGAGDRMILVAALGDVVQERRDIERAPAVDGAHDLARQRVLHGEFAALDVGQQADGADQMLVHREVVIHVELHHRHDAAEIRHEAAEHAGLVHLAQHRFRIARVRSAAP